MEARGLGVELGDPIGGEHLSDHEEAVRVILRDLGRIDEAGRGVCGMTVLERSGSSRTLTGTLARLATC